MRTNSNRQAIIVGATSGIGLEVARRLHSDGWTVGLTGRRSERLQAIAAEMSTRVFTASLDVRSEDASQRLSELLEKMGNVELIFLSAGIGKQNATLEADIEIETGRTNVEGFMRITNAAYHYFEKRGGGHLAAITSIAGTKGLGAAPAYSATKRFQNTYLQCLAQLAYMNHTAIRFTDIRPGFVDTDLLNSGSYPMLMKPEKVARHIVKALYKGRRVCVIDWRYRILTFFWGLIPNWLWEHLYISNKRRK